MDGGVANRPLGHLHDQQGPVARVDTDAFELSNGRGTFFVAALKGPSLAKSAVRVRAQGGRELRHLIAVYPPRHDRIVPYYRARQRPLPAGDPDPTAVPLQASNKNDSTLVARASKRSFPNPSRTGARDS